MDHVAESVHLAPVVRPCLGVAETGNFARDEPLFAQLLLVASRERPAGAVEDVAASLPFKEPRGAVAWARARLVLVLAPRHGVHRIEIRILVGVRRTSLPLCVRRRGLGRCAPRLCVFSVLPLSKIHIWRE